MNFLLDTNVISELRKKSPNPKLSEWIKDVSTADLYISCITLGEVQKGIINKAKTDIESARVLKKWLDKIIESYADKILAINQEVSLKWGEFISLDSTNSIDALIAAQADIYNMILVTRNTKQFLSFPIRVLNPFV